MEMVAGDDHETMEERTRRRNQAVLLERYVCSATDGSMTARAGVARSPDLSMHNAGTNTLHALGTGGDSLARQRTRNLTKYFSSLRSTYRRGLGEILGHRSEGEDEDWQTLLMVERFKQSAPSKPKPEAFSGPLTLVQQKKAKEAARLMQQREFRTSFKLTADALLGEDILKRKVQKTKSQTQWSKIRVSTKLAAVVKERRTLQSAARELNVQFSE